MARFLSDDWLAALDRAARAAADALAPLAPLVIEQVVMEVPDRGEVRFHLIVEEAGARVAPGPAPRADVRFTTKYTTAVEVACGRTNAQTALATGQLRLGGDLEGFGDRSAALAAVSDVFAAVRSSTTFPAAEERWLRRLRTWSRRRSVGFRGPKPRGERGEAMWGDVTPAERLRAVTRRGVDEGALAVEAADALAGFARDPASLVVACRRLLAHHAADGRLWWVCARILAASDAVSAAREAGRLLDADRTADRIGATLPLLEEGELVAAIGWPPAVDQALAERLDVDAVAVRVEGADPTRALRYRRTDRTVRVVEAWDPRLSAVTHLLVPAFAIGPDRALVPAGAIDAIATIRDAREVWLVGGVGRVLPARLFDAAVLGVTAPVDELVDVDDVIPEELSLQRVDRLAGPRGVEPTHEAAARVDCPVVPELLKPL